MNLRKIKACLWIMYIGQKSRKFIIKFYRDAILYCSEINNIVLSAAKF